MPKPEDATLLYLSGCRDLLGVRYFTFSRLIASLEEADPVAADTEAGQLAVGGYVVVIAVTPFGNYDYARVDRSVEPAQWEVLPTPKWVTDSFKRYEEYGGLGDE